jgi:predicted RNA methylase
VYGDISVMWCAELDGGGRSFGQQFVPVVGSLFGPVDRLFEFCAGPGFIGFSLLAHGLCKSLCLADVNPKAVEMLRATVAANGLEDRVTVYQSDGLLNIPDSEQWDLVVGNPPHFEAATEQQYRQDILTFDPAWSIHKSFYSSVHRHLKLHGSVLLIENASGSTPQSFNADIEHGSLEFVKSFMLAERGTAGTMLYFMWARKRHKELIDFSAAPRVLRLNASDLTPVMQMDNPCWQTLCLHIANDTDGDIEFGVHLGHFNQEYLGVVRRGEGCLTPTFLAGPGRISIYQPSAQIANRCTA